MKSFWYYFLGTIFIPRRAFNRLLSEPHKVAKVAKFIVFIGILYALTAAALAVSGALPMVPAWLKLSSENYYFWEIIFTVPVFVLDWILAAGLVLWLSRGGKKKGSGTFEDTLSTLGFAIAIPLFIAWIPQAAGATLLLMGMVQQEFVDLVSQPGFWQSLGVVYFIVTLAWLYILVSHAVSVSQKLSWWKTALVSFLTVTVFVLVLSIFIR